MFVQIGPIPAEVAQMRPTPGRTPAELRPKAVDIGPFRNQVLGRLGRTRPALSLRRPSSGRTRAKFGRTRPGSARGSLGLTKFHQISAVIDRVWGTPLPNTANVGRGSSNFERSPNWAQKPSNSGRCRSSLGRIQPILARLWTHCGHQGQRNDIYSVMPI